MPSGAALAGLARCDEADGDLETAHSRYEQALTVGRQLAEPSVTASSLEGLARLAAAAGDRTRAESMLAEAAEVRERGHRPAPPHERRDLDVVLAS